MASADPPMSDPLKCTDRKRASIVEAAIAEFHARGFPATSMDAIAARAGVSKRTIYNHFASKAELFCSISSEACRRVLDQTVEAYRPDRPLEEQLAKIAEDKLDLMSSRDFQRLVRVTLAERVRRPQVAAEAFAEIEKGEYGATKWFRAAVADGRLAVDDPVRVSKQFVALLKEFAFWPQLFGTRPPLDEAERRSVIDEAVAMIVGLYKT